MKLVSNYPLVVPAVGVFRPRDPGAAVNRSLAGAGSVDVVNVSEAGKILGVLLNVATAVTGTPTMKFEIVIDGSTQEDIPVYTAAATWVEFFRRLSAAMSSAGAGGNTLNDSFFLPLDCTYDTSLVVRANTTVAGSGGAVDVWVLRATKQ